MPLQYYRRAHYICDAPCEALCKQIYMHSAVTQSCRKPHDKQHTVHSVQVVLTILALDHSVMLYIATIAN
jgi:hypothetical protein